MNNACYEAARRGIIRGATADDVRDEAHLLLATASVSGATVTVAAETIEATTPDVTVTSSYPWTETAGFRPAFSAE